MSIQMKLINNVLKYTVKPTLTYTPFIEAIMSPAKIAVDLMTHAALRPKAQYKTVKIQDNLSGEWVDYNKIEDCKHVVLYLHGGGYIFGSSSTHRTITSSLSKHAKCRVFAVDYRKAPNNTYPAALEDAVVAYMYLILKGYSSENISIAGDSAGGNLTLAVTRKLIDIGMPAPASICAISPWCALYELKEYFWDNDNDPMLPGNRIQEAGEMYAGKNISTKDPRVSPMHMKFDGFPPSMFTVGSKEVLYNSIVKTFYNLKKDTCDDTSLFMEYEGCSHVFQIFYGIVPEAKHSIIDISNFFRDSWN